MTELSRRKFIQLSVIGSAVTATGCDPKVLSRYSPGLYRAEVTGTYGGYDNRVYPYVNQPDGLMDGVPQYFATVCQMCPAGCGLLVRTMSGRAIKIEGNPAHPVSMGGSCARGQAALQHLYNPDRLRQPHLHAKRGGTVTFDRPKAANPPDERPQITEVDAETTDWETALGKVTTGLTGARGKVAILADAQYYGSSPTQSRLINEFAAKIGGTVVSYSVLDDAPWRAAAQAVYGKNQLPAYQLAQADVIVSFGGDFLEAWPSPVYYGRLFGDFRQGPRRTQGDHGRFIYIGPRMSMTAAKADLWLPCKPGTEAIAAQAVAAAVQTPGASLAEYASATGLTEAQLAQVASAFQSAGTRAVAVGGNGLLGSANPTAAFTAVESLNTLVKSQCVGFGTAAVAAPAVNPQSSGLKGIQSLTQAMNSGQVGALIILGEPNPVFTLPPSVGFTQALAKVPFIAALTIFEDETTAYADVVLPTRSFLEEWGDNVPPVIPPGIRMATLRQPIIDPQFVGGHGEVQDNAAAFVPWWDTRPIGDLLADIARRAGTPMTETGGRAAVRKTWAGIGQATLTADTTENDTTENDTPWVSALATGGYWVQPPPAQAPRVPPAAASALSAAASALSAPAVKPGQFMLQVYPHIYWNEGRNANLGWMQETPDPMTSAVWNSWIEINMQVAHEMGVRTGDLIRITSPYGVMEALAIPYPGIHPGAVAMPMGQGHTVYGRNAAGRGRNPFAILAPTADPLTGALAYSTTPVTLTKIASAQTGYNSDNTTLVLAQDRPGGAEPEAVKDLIHTTAKEWKTAKRVSGAPEAAGSIFTRKQGESE